MKPRLIKRTDIQAAAEVARLTPQPVQCIHERALATCRKCRRVPSSDPRERFNALFASVVEAGEEVEQ